MGTHDLPDMYARSPRAVLLDFGHAYRANHLYPCYNYKMFFIKSLKFPTNAFNIPDYVKFTSENIRLDKLQDLRSSNVPTIQQTPSNMEYPTNNKLYVLSLTNFLWNYSELRTLILKMHLFFCLSQAYIVIVISAQF